MIKLLAKSFFLALIILACSSGENNSSGEDCKYGSPTPIFSDTLRGVKSHQFSLEKNNSEEEIKIDNDIDLTIYQSGCNSIRQDFHFTLKGDYSDKELEFWILESVNQFNSLAQLHPNYQVYQLWGQAILENGQDLKKGESRELDKGFYFKMDWIASESSANLMLTLSENE